MGTAGMIPWSLALVAVGVLTLAAGPPPPGKDGQATSVETVKGKDGAPMILIPAGPFTMGSNDGLPNERPEHPVELGCVLHRSVRSDVGAVSEVPRCREARLASDLG